MSEIEVTRAFPHDPAAVARDVIRANRYMTLATADPWGVPWASPVWFAATDDLARFLWVSHPDARHSRNVAARPDVGLVLFDSGLAPGAGQAFYASAVAEELTGPELERGIAVFAARSQEQGLPAWAAADVRAPARHRLYRATVRECFVLGARDERVAVPSLGTSG
jgi:hypothetical protein